MHTQAHNLGAEAGFQAVFPNDIPVDRCWIQVPIKATGPIVLHWPEQSPFDIAPMSCLCQIIFNHPLGCCVNRNEADLGPLAFDTKMHDTLSAVQVLHPQAAEFFTSDTVVQQGSQDGPIPNAFGVSAGGALPTVCGPARRRVPACCLRSRWPFHSVYRIAGDGVAFAEIMVPCVSVEW